MIRDLPTEITIFADLCDGTIAFKIEDVWYGIAFENIDIDEDLYFAYWVGKPGFTCTIKNSPVFFRAVSAFYTRYLKQGIVSHLSKNHFQELISFL